MNTTEFVSAVYLKAERKLPTFTTGSSKWLNILGIANAKIDLWQNEPSVDWNSLYDPSFSIGTISATNVYDLDDEVRLLSNEPGDTVTITRLDGNVTEFITVKANRLKSYPHGNYCAKVGRTLVFNRTFTATDAEFGGAITAPVYLYAEHLVNDNDEVPVDDPEWLVTVTAAEYNRTDVTKANQYGILINEANSLMEAMKDANDQAQVEYLSKGIAGHGAQW